MLFGKKIVAVCMAGIHNESNIKFMTQLNDSLVPHDYRFLIFNIGTDLNWNHNNEDSEVLVFDLINYETTDTIVILDEQIKDRQLVDKIVEKAKQNSVQVIIIDGKYQGCVNVRFDYRAGFEMLVRHVMEEHKPSTVHFIAGFKDNIFSEERVSVFKKVIEESGLVFNDSMVSYGDFWAIPAVKATQKLIDENRVPEAIICANDIMAINIISFLSSKGYRVPEDVIVTGFDGVEEIHLTKPRITSGYCDRSSLAKYAIDAIVHEELDKDYVVVPDLLISESCGCKYTNEINIFDSPERLNARFYNYQEDSRILMQMSENVQTCESVDDISQAMRNRVMKHTCVILNKWCQDSSIKPISKNHSGIDDEMFMFYESRDWQPHEIYDFSKDNYVPGLDKLFDRATPIVFTELDYMNVPLGYVCFFYKSCNSIYYKKIPHIVSALNNGIGGWTNQRYQRYLTNQVEHIYEHDALTGILNRLGFEKRLDELVANIGNNKFTAVMSDLDGLKYINDTFGHIAGDKAIQIVAKALVAACPDNALCVRFGGDEMLAVMEGDCKSDDIRAAFQRYLDDFNNRHEVPFTVSSSIGILQEKGNELGDQEKVFKMVDDLMYEEKKKKKHR